VLHVGVVRWSSSTTMPHGYVLVIMIHSTLNLSVFVSCVIQSVGDYFGGSRGETPIGEEHN